MARRQKGRKGCGRFLLGISLVLVAVTAVITLGPLLDQRHRVVIDPGHGGGDPGAPGVVQESLMTEQTAALLAALLETDGRFRVWTTRDEGSSASLADRCRTARVHRAELMLSIHGNSAEDASASGFECYPAPPGRQHHEKSLRFASLLAAQMEEAGASLRGVGGIRYAYYDEEGNKELVDASDETVREEPSFAVVDSAGCPSVLAEQCFVTNPSDVALFGDEAGCARAAMQYYRAILRYFGEEEQPQSGGE